MDEATIEKYKLAGKIAAKALEHGVKHIKSGVKLLNVAEEVESKIKKLGANIAFPVNISINEIAAHYSPICNDKLVFKKGDVVKLDIGTHIDGYIADTATTIEVETNKYSDMIKAADEGLKTAISLMKPGVDLTNLGHEVKNTITGFGFKPVDNLTGHSLKRFVLHAGLSIPSVPDVLSKTKPQTGDVLAIEPFATNGKGHVTTGAGSNIYLCNKSLRLRIVRDNRAKIWYNRLLNSYNTLPFAQRWVDNIYEKNVDIILNRLSFLGMVRQYPQLVEQKKGIVTQKEHTVILTDDGCEVTT